jgi:hypothetical protein
MLGWRLVHLTSEPIPLERQSKEQPFMTMEGHLSLTLPGYLHVEVELAEVDTTEAIYGFTSTSELRALIESNRPGLTQHMPTSRIAFLTILTWLSVPAEAEA